MNMLDCFAEQPEQAEIVVFTTSSINKNYTYHPSSKKKVKLIRLGVNRPENASVLRYLFYARFYIISFFYCFVWQPDVAFYVESISALPALYLKRIRRSLKLMAHYHEYMSPDEYAQSALLKYIYDQERAMIRQFDWLSHTNQIRCGLFLKDIGLEEGQVRLEELPNFPSARWAGTNRKTTFNKGPIVHFVYVGSLGTTEFYFDEVIEWIEAQKGSAMLHIYASRNAVALEGRVNQRGFRYTVFHEAVAYKDLPAELVKYDIGLIIYKPLSPNVVFCAPNKLFEYLTIGLDVWFPKDMVGALPYTNTSTHPMVLPMDFLKMDEFVLERSYAGIPSAVHSSAFQSEAIYGDLWKKLIND
jgi:hypothetical protein